ncbi:hypothetical protein F5Y15DRAFT_415234 [Xylariaceae sp. FL0016]|nr:hypothetical protein F5Y15DRAFT_415234 [Xylariaceae sp. FL0016]
MAESTETGAEPLVCEKVGEAMPDIAGIGILLGFSAQAFISLCLSIWVFFLSKIGHLEVRHDEGTAEHESEKKRLEIVSSMLMVGNDIQMITGNALIITALSELPIIDIYHLRLVFDTVSFVGYVMTPMHNSVAIFSSGMTYRLIQRTISSVSNSAALICYNFIMTKKYPGISPWQKVSRMSGRLRVSYIFALLFLVLTIALEVRLDGWSFTAEEAGHCYRTVGSARPGAPHPAAEKAYVAITAIYLLLSVFSSVLAPPRLRHTLLVITSLQYPVHLYMMLAIRLANQDHLEGAEDENGWDFGQTTAVLLLSIAVSELINKGFAYRRFEKALQKHGPGYVNAGKHDEGMSNEDGTGLMTTAGFAISTLVESGNRRLHQTGSHTPTSQRRGNGLDDEGVELMRNNPGR